MLLLLLSYVLAVEVSFISSDDGVDVDAPVDADFLLVVGGTTSRPLLHSLHLYSI